VRRSIAPFWRAIFGLILLCALVRPIPAAEQLPQAPDPIVDAKRMLKSLGFDVGPPTSELDNKTRAAVTTFQKTRGMAADGQITPELLSALRTISGSDAPSGSTRATGAANVDQYFRTGFEALKANRLAEAETAFITGLSIHDDAQAEYYLGETYRLNGKRTAAIDRYKKVMTLSPNGEFHSRANEGIRQALIPSGTWKRSWTKDWGEGAFGQYASTFVFQSNSLFEITERTNTFPPRQKAAGCPDSTKVASDVIKWEFVLGEVDPVGRSVSYDKVSMIRTSVYPPCWNHPDIIPTGSKSRLHWEGDDLYDDDRGDPGKLFKVQ
jgi:hypothetical protein